MKLYMKCLNCGENFSVDIIGEEYFACPKCNRKYLHKYVGDGQYEVIDLTRLKIKEFVERGAK